eukprot:TRINITY_DN15604_c0_g1_i2.p1 TRINITY_DN15604_c0_g1~~TRINITY_DN15604_c0_g1_i2.p1  ORF type:complete len:391 (+),score=58.84 TRINITY_DN15604_c0_g1_i2:62-1234(+)
MQFWLAVAASAAAVAPTVPPQWTADLSLRIVLSGKDVDSTGIFAFDAPNKRMYYSSITNMSVIAPASWVGTGKELSIREQWSLDDSVFMGLNQREYLVSNLPFNETDQFSWVPYAQFEGNATINGVTVLEYSFTYPPSGAYYKYYTLPDGTPVREVMNNTLPQPQYIQYDFANVRALNTSVFNGFDKTAAYNPPVCPVGSVVPVTLDMYIFHPRANVDVTGQDTADLAGDTGFVCMDALSNNTQADHYDVVSWYKVQVLPVWGQYEACNGYPPFCAGGTRFYVGREVAFGITDYGGQCSDTDLATAGTWWSLPAGGACAENATPGDGSCSWKVVERVKTIDAVQCLFGQQKMLESCLKEQRMPFPDTQKIFQTAFTESDAAKGGCPSIQP